MMALFYNDAVGKFILRLTVGILIMFHGVAKILHSGSLDFIGGMLSQSGLPTFLAYGVFIGEILAPVLLIIGVYCRYGGALIVINMLVAIGLAHTGDIFMLNQNGGWQLELQGFYLFGGLAVLFLGSGRLALKPD